MVLWSCLFTIHLRCQLSLLAHPPNVCVCLCVCVCVCRRHVRVHKAQTPRSPQPPPHQDQPATHQPHLPPQHRSLTSVHPALAAQGQKRKLRRRPVRPHPRRALHHLQWILRRLRKQRRQRPKATSSTKQVCVRRACCFTKGLRGIWLCGSLASRD